MTPPPEGQSDPRFDALIIGGGQAGLAVCYHLAKRGRPLLILGANQRIGDAGRNRWDSLRVFTPTRYAARFTLPVRTGLRVDRVSRLGDRFLVTPGDQRFEADNVVVATGSQVGRMNVVRRHTT